VVTHPMGPFSVDLPIGAKSNVSSTSSTKRLVNNPLQCVRPLESSKNACCVGQIYCKVNNC
jgi:hypothetical protein